jgi:peptidoglycan/LPS O-acetylase OafA/YrhL
VQKLSGRIPELDGVRGVAIAMILMWHYFIPGIKAPPGTALSYLQAAGRLAWSGVDLFFVLSGFLIGGILLDSRDSPDYFRTFYRRRFFRIVPLYAIILVGSFLFKIFLDTLIGQRFSFMYSNPLPWAPFAFFFQNLWMAARSSGGILALGITWSLAIEEQFYITLPPLIRFVNPHQLAIIIQRGVLTASALRILLFELWPNYPLLGVVTMPCRADSLLLGVLGAVALRDPRWRARIEDNRRILVFALVVFALGMVIFTKMRPDLPYGSQIGLVMLWGGYTWIAMFYLSFILFVVVHNRSWLARCMRFRWLMWMGSIAYGAYMYHQVVRGAIFGIIWGRDQPYLTWPVLTATVAALAITLTLCYFSWTYVEKPLIQIGHRK